MSPHDGDWSSSMRPSRNGGPDVLKMVSSCRQAWKLGRGLDDRVGNSQSLSVKRHLLVARNQLVRLGSVQWGKLIGFLHNQLRSHLTVPGTVGDHIADGGHADNPFPLSLCHEKRPNQDIHLPT